MITIADWATEPGSPLRFGIPGLSAVAAPKPYHRRILLPRYSDHTHDL